MTHANVKQWMTDLDTASLAILARRADLLANLDFYRLKSDLCPDHGAGCVQVVFGELKQHVRWRLNGPAKFAEALLETVLPRPQ